MSEVSPTVERGLSAEASPESPVIQRTSPTIKRIPGVVFKQFSESTPKIHMVSERSESRKSGSGSKSRSSSARSGSRRSGPLTRQATGSRASKSEGDPSGDEEEGDKEKEETAESNSDDEEEEEVKDSSSEDEHRCLGHINGIGRKDWRRNAFKTITTRKICRRKYFNHRRWQCLSRPEYNTGSGIAALVSCWNYLYSALGCGRLAPITVSDALQIVGFHEPYDKIDFGPITGNRTIRDWFTTINLYFDVFGSMRQVYRSMESFTVSTTQGRLGDDALDFIKKALRSGNTALMYHCEDHFLCPLGFEDTPPAPSVAYTNAVGTDSSLVNSWLLLGDTANTGQPVFSAKWLDIVQDIESKELDFFDIRHPEKGVQTRTCAKPAVIIANGTTIGVGKASVLDALPEGIKKIAFSNNHCIIAFTRKGTEESRRIRRLRDGPDLTVRESERKKKTEEEGDEKATGENGEAAATAEKTDAEQGEAESQVSEDAENVELPGEPGAAIKYAEDDDDDDDDSDGDDEEDDEWGDVDIGWDRAIKRYVLAEEKVLLSFQPYTATHKSRQPGIQHRLA